MAHAACKFKSVSDLTTQGSGVNIDADPLVMRKPRINCPVPGQVWAGDIGLAKSLIRLPDPESWNGKLMIGATPAVRNEYSLDLLLSDIALQRGYAYASCDKGTPLLTLRNPDRQMTEWPEHYLNLTETAIQAVHDTYGMKPKRVYISGVSNGGYITRVMLERFGYLYDGGVDWEGVLWSETGRHLLTYLPTYVQDYPIYCNWRGDKTQTERDKALDRLLEAGLHPLSEPYWNQYYMMYWIVSLWLYGRNLDPEWVPFHAEWSNDWLIDPSPLHYVWQERQEILSERIQGLVNTGQLTKPLLSIAGNWDCLIPYRHNAKAYADLVETAKSSTYHRVYEINRGNHVEGFLRTNMGQQQSVHPYFEAAICHLENWVEREISPPDSGVYNHISQFTQDNTLFTL